MEQKTFEVLKSELQHKAKNGIDFITAASLVWLLIYGIWTLDSPAFSKSIFTFMIGALLLPLALGFSKIFKTEWKIKNNPLQPLGLWLNFAQLIYFPFLFFLLYRNPEYFIMGYAIITGAHLFPYAWLYDEMGYAIAAVLISVGSLVISLSLGLDGAFYIPLCTALLLALLALWIFYRLKILTR
ncbi:hypothetical protein D2V93_01960 [Flagellimonas taeanensis]|jgi:hypothetical protein|uniref:SPW repeat-containing protein n=1 Tax=Flagellimonas taeanensis TaxID=1005926 RepID=A0A1M7ARM5_9FLAO|nr:MULTISPECIES: hypothetical protein [Allomuricauda]MDC6384682.1 hypothetical protein [Muricauda sp. SK9]MEE1962725.1 hypothetical protein [Allomuricauda taeanensis]RIV53572.1 hypothetical protein D2V93_01960 [Allomuricauda taeanensis]SFC35412.1 hypothetical protein SAMN04487891_109139 [Allomuricauda taeanensis]SHL45307.1 hypothetical protein SAMN05216293_3512 [Allomuricauda taeanensis]